ncbi:MAG: hypothetical protein PHO10_08950 [Gemmiger sp.]|nr:hypothetical protein [Gemmiger sp.]
MNVKSKNAFRPLCRFAGKHKFLSAIFLVEVLVLLTLVAGLFRPVFTLHTPAGEMANLQQGVLLEATGPAGERTLSPQQETATAFAGLAAVAENGRVPWLQSAPFALSAGRYTCTVRFTSDAGQTDTAGVTTFLSSDAATVSPDVLLKGDTGVATGTVWLNSATKDLRLTIYAQTASLRVTDITVTETYAWRLVRLLEYLLAFLLVDLLLLALTPKNRLSLGTNQRLVLLGLLGVVAVASLPAFSGFVSYGFDLEFHLSRISGIAAGLQGGQFPVRIYPDSLNGYGYASPVFYGDILLYFPALLHLLGYPLYAAYNAYLVLLNVLTAGITFLCLQKMFGSLSLSMVGTTLYTTASYRIFNLYYRPALGESSAQTFLPLLVYGFWALFSESATERQRKNAWLPLMLGFTGVIQTHVITTEIAALASLTLCLVLAGRLLQKGRLWALLKGAGATVLLNLWFLVPFFSYMQGDYACTATDTVFAMDKHSIPLAKLFSLWGEDMEDIRIGAALVAGLGLYIFCRVYWPELSAKARKLGLACAAGGLVAVFLASEACHWGGLENWVGTTAAHYLCAIQFPFRYLTLTTVLFCFVSVCAVALLRQKLGQRAALAAACLLMGVSCLSTWLDGGQYIRGLYGKSVIAQGSELSSGEKTSGLEYLPTAFAADLHRAEVAPNLGVNITSAERLPVGYTVTAQNTGVENASIEFPLTYYPGYRITKNTGGDLAVAMAEDGTVAVTLGPGYTGSFAVAFVEPFSWRLAEAVSLGFGVLLVLGRLLPTRKRKKAVPAAQPARQ